MVGWSVGWLVVWFVDWLVGWLHGCLASLRNLQFTRFLAASLCFACLLTYLLCLDLRRNASIAFSALLRLFSLLGLLARGLTMRSYWLGLTSLLAQMLARFALICVSLLALTA